MAIQFKEKYGKATRSTRIENSGGPVVTTDEVATAIQVDEDGDATGFTSLTNHYCSKCYSSQVIS